MPHVIVKVLSGIVEGQVIGMDVDVPEAGHEIPAFEIDHLRVASAARLSAWQDGADAAILDQHGTIRPYFWARRSRSD